MTTKVLFVCLGNICRSPTAHGLFQDKVNQAGLQDFITVDSAGTGDWHIGREPDKRAQQTALQKGYDISHLRARQVCEQDFAEFDYIVAMDQQNLLDLQAMAPNDYSGHLGLFLSLADVSNETLRDQEVPDPYYGGPEQFEYAIELITAGAEGLLERIRQQQ